MTASPLCKIETAGRFTAFALAITAFTLANALPDGAHAQNFGSFTLEASEKEGKLVHQVDMMWDKWFMWDTATQREAERNMPYFQLTNSSTSTAPLTQLLLTIGDSRFNFAPVEGGHFALRGGITTHTLTSSTVGNLGNELVVNIGNGGLAPGQSIRFKINLDVDATFADAYEALLGPTEPDFRTILFDMNGKNIYNAGMPVNVSTADNAMARAVFDPANGPNFETAPSPFADEAVPGGDVFANRQYGDMDPVLIFDLEGSTPPVIPEPGGIAMVVAATLCAVVVRSGSRRRMVAA